MSKIWVFLVQLFKVSVLKVPRCSQVFEHLLLYWTALLMLMLLQHIFNIKILKIVEGLLVNLNFMIFVSIHLGVFGEIKV